MKIDEAIIFIKIPHFHASIFDDRHQTYVSLDLFPCLSAFMNTKAAIYKTLPTKPRNKGSDLRT
jgi:hypothetical protein